MRHKLDIFQVRNYRDHLEAGTALIIPSCNSSGQWKRCQHHIMSTAKKSSPEAKTTPSKGVAVARANRSECNSLSNDQRDMLTSRAMNLIYGSNGPQIPAHRR